MMAKTHTIADCFRHATGQEPFTESYLRWCEHHLSRWSEIAAEFGYAAPTFEIRDLSGGSLKYHEWLKREVGL